MFMNFIYLTIYLNFVAKYFFTILSIRQERIRNVNIYSYSYIFVYITFLNFFLTVCSVILSLPLTGYIGTELPNMCLINAVTYFTKNVFI